MSSDTTLNLSVPELLRALNKKLGVECTRARENCFSPILDSISVNAEIDSLEARANDVLKLVPTLRNLLQPVNRLPSEIISRIARCILDEKSTPDVPLHYFMGKGTIDTINTRSLVPLTHVCRYWRGSIISTPENWTLISSRSEGLMELSLQRAKAAPLEIHLDMYQVRESPWFTPLIAPHIQNTETLHIYNASSIDEFSRALSNFPQSTPNLRSLTIIRDTFHRGLDWSMDLSGPSIPPLTHLSLMYIQLYPAFLHLRTLTDLTLGNFQLNTHLDTLLDFLEENRSLERATLHIEFRESILRSSRRRVAIRNRLRSLSIRSLAKDAEALISKIALQSGAHLEIIQYGFADLLHSVVRMPHLWNLESPTLIEHHFDDGSIRLLGPNGSFSFEGPYPFDYHDRYVGDPFAKFPPSHLTDIRVLHIRRRATKPDSDSIVPTTFPLPSLPALEALAIEREATLSDPFSALFSNPSSSPSLKTIAFLDCALDEDFMEELTRFASNRKETTSAWLYRVIIVNSKGRLPSVASIDEIGRHVPVVDARIGKKLPADLI